MQTRRLACFMPFGLLAMLTLSAGSVAASTPAGAVRSQEPSQQHDQAQAFDFLYGRWRVQNRRLVQRLQESEEWVEFESTDEVRPLPGGLGNEEHYRTGYWEDFVGLGLRLYDPDRRQWTIYWADNRNNPGTFQPPVTGSFADGVGTFEGPDEFNGQPIVVRFIWASLGDGRARWEQAFSADNGQTWETNWTMDFTRVSE